ncbi:MAG: GNAT family N-acetyltransferase [Beijerinckiaceae bacterium]|nr:GNAT family N-acetyltransferase [Beijerinckiaceae bacterium]
MFFARTAAGETYGARLHESWAAAAAAWADSMETRRATCFQSDGWYAAWYATIGSSPGYRPVIVEIFERATGEFALGLPLASIERGGLTSIEFADDEVTDYNFPILGPAAPTCAQSAMQAFQAMARALLGADVLHLKKMPVRIGDLANPFAQLPRAALSPLRGNFIPLGEYYDAWLRTLARKERKEIGRIWRVFSALENASFFRARTPDAAGIILDMIETEQKNRRIRLGRPYRLDQREHASFYRRLIEREDDACKPVVTALTVGGRPIAGLLGVATGQTCILLRLAFAEGPWERSGPGRVLIDRTMRALHAEGYRTIDLGIGDYRYKRQLDPKPFNLVDVTQALSMRGLPRASGAWAKARVRENAVLERWARRLLAYTGR